MPHDKSKSYGSYDVVQDVKLRYEKLSLQDLGIHMIYGTYDMSIWYVHMIWTMSHRLCNITRVEYATKANGKSE